MRKIILLLLSVVLFCCTGLFMACDKEITIKFEGNGGTLVSGESEVTIRIGEEFAAPKFEREGYVFDGWSIKLSEIKESCIVKAKWTHQIIVNFDSNGGTECDKIMVAYNSQIYNLPTPTKGQEDDYTFLGWKYKGNILENGAKWNMDEREITLIACWQSNWTKPY